MIGIDRNTSLVYEGASTYGHGIWPTPIVAPCRFIETEAQWNDPDVERVDNAKFVFREDSFDPVTRIRRGRLYEWSGGVQPTEWMVQPHIARPSDQREVSRGGLIRRTLLSYTPVRGTARRILGRVNTVLVVGTEGATTTWQVLSVEGNFSGEELIILRARSSLGAVPELLNDAIEPDSRDKVTQACKSVAEMAYRGSAEAVIDHCRDASQVIMSRWISTQTGNAEFLTKDLGKLVSALAEQFRDRSGLKDALDLIRLLHPRGKSNEQIRHGLRPPTFGDAQLALEAYGFLLREIGWAE